MLKFTSNTRTGSAARQVILFGILVVLGVAVGYDYLVARPGYDKAWKFIESIDESMDSASYTAEKIEEEIGKKPVKIDRSHYGAEVRTYRWIGGTLVRHHDIHVVYTKPIVVERGPTADLTDDEPVADDATTESEESTSESEEAEAAVATKPEIYDADELVYYSASGNKELTSTNFPPERQTMVWNLNKPSMGGGGGGGGGGGDSNDDGGDDASATEKSTEGAETEGNDGQMTEAESAEGAGENSEESANQNEGGGVEEGGATEESESGESSAEEGGEESGDDGDSGASEETENPGGSEGGDAGEGDTNEGGDGNGTEEGEGDESGEGGR